MSTSLPFLVSAFITAVVSTVVAPPAPVAQDGFTPTGNVSPEGFTLIGDVPSDVFLCVATRHNPEREFLDRYWNEVFAALVQSGVGNDALDLLGALFGGEVAGEGARLRDRASELLAHVDWEQLVGQEMVFAERFDPSGATLEQRPPILTPDFVCLLRGSTAGAAQNYDGLVGILSAATEEINRIAGTEALAVETTTRLEAKVTSVNVLAGLPGAPPLRISVALRGDVIIIAFRDQLFDDVLALLAGTGAKKSLAADARFQGAFAKLPAAKDELTFFDMQALIRSLHTLLNSIMGAVESPRDVYANAGTNSAASALNSRALSAYQRGDVQQALTLTQQAYEADPRDSIALYNLACFNALLGNRNEAIDWLEKAVAGGFYAPDKIATDSDLKSLHDEPRYQAARAKAAELALQYGAEDVLVNSTRTGEVPQLTMQAWQAYEQKDYERGLKLVEQAYAIAPKDSQVLYSLACFHALLGHEDRALEFLQQAVDGGFYCPRHIAKDPDLESLRTHERYRAALVQARKMAGQAAAGERGGESGLIKHILDRLAEAAGVFDYTATVESTKDYAVWTESRAVLVAGASAQPIYSVFGKRPPVTNFARYLPQETASFSVSNGADWTALYKFLEDTVRLGGPQGADLLAKWAELQQQVGVDVRKDVLDWIAGDFISVTLAQERGSVWLLKVTDEQVARAKVGAAIQFLSTKLSETIGKEPGLAPLAMIAVQASPVTDQRLEGFENLHFALSPEPAVWGVTDGHLIFGSSADAVALCLQTARGEHPDIRSNPRSVAEALLPAGPVTNVALTDQREMGEGIAKGIGIAAMISGMLGAFVPDPEARPVIAKITGILSKLTPVARKIDFYKSTASSTTFDGQAWHTRGVTHYFSPEERAAKRSP